MIKNKLICTWIFILLIAIMLPACDMRKNNEVTTAATTDAKVTDSGESNVVTDPSDIETSSAEVDYDKIDANYGIDSMTLEEKAAQMILVSCHTKVDIADAVGKGVGGLCLYAFSFEDKTKDQIIDMTSYYQSLADIPLIISTDEEGGTVNRVSLNENLRAVPFWSCSDLYAYGGWDLIKSDTEEKAELLLSLGINVNLAPVCDVPLSEDNYIYDRTFGLNAEETGEYVSLTVSVMKENGIGSVLKHFPGYGGSVDTHANVAYDYRDYSDFENCDFIPFKCGIESGADAVLVSHNIVTTMDDEMPASLSENVHNILRTKLSFTGVIMTDDLVMDGITQFTDGESAALYAVLAGNDMLCCEDYDEAINAIVDGVNNGLIDEAQIDASVARILKWKADLNLL